MLKKWIPAALIALFLTACAGSPPLEDPNRTAEEVTFQGIIEPIELSLYQKGTHRLTTAEGREVLIASPTVNLNHFPENEVKVQGRFEQTLDRDQPLLIVDQAAWVDIGRAGDEKTFQNRAYGFSFRYPGSYDLREGDSRLLLIKDQRERITIDMLSTVESLDGFLKDREVEDGVPVTIAGQAGRRYTEGNEIRVYLPGQRGYVYRFTLLAGEEDTGLDQRAYYDLLDSLTVFFFKKETGEPCGGPENLTCVEGFRCELGSGEKDAEGVCVSLTDTAGDALCPFVAPPRECQDFKVSGFNPDGCPVSYECLDKKPAAESEKPQTEPQTEPKAEPDVSSGVSDDVSDEALAEPTASAKPDVKPTEPAPAPSTPAPSAPPPPEGDLTRSYENPYHHFTVYYHKNWYFKSFGGTDDVLWHVGFADRSLDAPEDALIVLKLVGGAEDARRSREAEGVYTFLVPRDDVSHFVLEGPSSLKALIEEMAQSLAVSE